MPLAASHHPTAPRAGAGLPPAPEHSVLFAVLGFEPGLYLDAAAPSAQPSRLAREFADAGWRGMQLAVAGDGTQECLGRLLATAGTPGAQWLALRGSAALRALAHWQGDGCRPPVLLVESGQAALPAPNEDWRAALSAAGYRFVLSADGLHYFVGGDQPALMQRVAEAASLAWQARLQEGRKVLAQALRETEQARGALRVAQSDAMAATARASMLQQHIDAILASSSWKITKPLRWAMRLRRDPGPALQQLRSVARRLAQALLRRVAGRLQASPALGRRAAALGWHFPALARRLAALAAPAAAPGALHPLPLTVDPDNIVGPQFKSLLLEELDATSPRNPDCA